MIKFKTIGSDPEFFVLDPKGNPYPATPFATGTKEFPCPIPDLPGYYEQRDNLSFEGNIPPASTKEEFINNVTTLRDYFARKVAKYDYSLSPNGVEYFDKRFRSSPEGMEFGCSTVIDSWMSKSGTNELQERPTPVLGDVGYRVSGFHIHIGYNPVTIVNDLAIARLFDLFLTIPSQRIKPERERIMSYGRYGMIRRKSYGIECRTLSSYFTQKDYLPWVWDQLFKLENFVNECDPYDLGVISRDQYYIGTTEDQVTKIFNLIFNNFKNKKVLTKFKETNEILQYKVFKPTPTSDRYYNTSYYSSGDYDTSTF